ncbi:MAG: ribosome small subunit-dependent GTPase A [Selenomonas sp.]|nr:ribosome small subunit-dependent GTPase A [Selenomonas sp.]
MLQGRVIKAYNSFFYVQTDMGLVTCKLRGKFKKFRQELGVVPGDWVSLDALPDGTGVIEEVQPRIQLLKRPAVANLTQVVLTFAAAQPDVHPLLLNRFLVLAEWSGMEKILICVNKMDLFVGNEENFLQDYRAIGYEVLPVSAREGKGLEALRQRLRGETTVFAGPSGVGKSSLLNAIDSRLALQTGVISEKIKRGRHTTRVAELLPYGGGGYIVDTPGFSAVDLMGMEPEELPACFPEFAPYLGKCRFSPCSHSHEPGCAVKEAAEAGAVARERYEAYLAIRTEIQEAQKLSQKKLYR